MGRFARDLGLELVNPDPMRQICTFLRTATTVLIVLDNAETFEEASGSSALCQIPPVITNIADTPGIVLILTSRSRRNAPNVPWITNRATSTFNRNFSTIYIYEAHHLGKVLSATAQFQPCLVFADPQRLETTEFKFNVFTPIPFRSIYSCCGHTFM